MDLNYLARSTSGLTGADLHNILNQAALQVASDDLPSVSPAAINHALDRISMGPERKSAIVSAESIRRTAYHEAAHALVALKTEG